MIWGLLPGLLGVEGVDVLRQPAQALALQLVLGLADQEADDGQMAGAMGMANIGTRMPRISRSTRPTAGRPQDGKRTFSRSMFLAILGKRKRPIISAMIAYPKMEYK